MYRLLIPVGAARDSAGSFSMTDAVTAHLRIAWGAFKASWRVFVLSMLILFVSWVCLEVAVITLHGLGVVVNVLLHLAFLVWFSGLMAGLHAMVLQTIDGRTPALKDLFTLLGRGPAFLFAVVLYLVAVAVGLVLLVLPGIYLAVRYAFFGYILATKPVSALEALRFAGALANGRWWALFGFFLVILALNIAGAALLGVGFFISYPVSLLAGASLFRTLE